ncbi:hypothetical protein NUSPORA_01399 [Nucleospora cyclopteri]
MKREEVTTSISVPMAVKTAVTGQQININEGEKDQLKRLKNKMNLIYDTTVDDNDNHREKENIKNLIKEIIKENQFKVEMENKIDIGEAI